MVDAEIQHLLKVLKDIEKMLSWTTYENLERTMDECLLLVKRTLDRKEVK